MWMGKNYQIYINNFLYMQLKAKVEKGYEKIMIINEIVRYIKIKEVLNYLNGKKGYPISMCMIKRFIIKYITDITQFILLII